MSEIRDTVRFDWCSACCREHKYSDCPWSKLKDIEEEVINDIIWWSEDNKPKD